MNIVSKLDVILKVLLILLVSFTLVGGAIVIHDYLTVKEAITEYEPEPLPEGDTGIWGE